MRNMFSPAELEKAEAVSGNCFNFTKGCLLSGRFQKETEMVRKISVIFLINGKDSEEAKHIDNNSMVNAANFGDKLFDMEKDPKQTTVLEDNAIEAYMANLQKAMKENDCPMEQFECIGISGTEVIREEDIHLLHKKEKEALQPSILKNLAWSKGAINTYQALMKFIPASDKEHVREVLETKIPTKITEEKIIPNNILDIIPDVIPEEYVDMVEYFVGLSGRTE